MSIFGAGHEVVTSTTKPSSPSVGQLIYCTDTDEYLKYVVDLDSTSRWMQASLKPNRNLIINGGMSVAQRTTSLASITTTGYYTADRFAISLATTGTWTQSVENDAPTGSGLRKSLKMLCTTADPSLAAGDTLRFRQYIEGQNVQHIAKGTAAAKKLTLSFWVKSNVTGIYIAELTDNNNSRSVSAAYSILVSGTWEKKTITFPADLTGVFTNDNNLSLMSTFYLSSGSNGTSGTLSTVWAATVEANRAVGQTNLAAATSNYWQVTGVQLEVGSAPSEFEFEPYEAVLRKCLRYYQFGGTPAPMGYSFYNPIGDPDLRGTNFPISLPVEMRTTPTATTSVTNNDNFVLYDTKTSTKLVTFRFRANNTAYPYGTGSTTYTLSAEL